MTVDCDTTKYTLKKQHRDTVSQHYQFRPPPVDEIFGHKYHILIFATVVNGSFELKHDSNDDTQELSLYLLPYYVELNVISIQNNTKNVSICNKGDFISIKCLTNGIFLHKVEISSISVYQVYQVIHLLTISFALSFFNRSTAIH